MVVLPDLRLGRAVLLVGDEDDDEVGVVSQEAVVRPATQALDALEVLQGCLLYTSPSPRDS